MARLISGAVLLIAVIAALWFLPPIYLLGIAVLVALLAFREYLDIAARAGAQRSSTRRAARFKLVFALRISTSESLPSSFTPRGSRIQIC